MSGGKAQSLLRVAVTEDREIIFGATGKTWIGTLVEVRGDDFIVKIPRALVEPSKAGVVERVREAREE